MSVSDALMWRYFELLSARASSEIADMRMAVETGTNPRDIKFELAREMVQRFHGAQAGERAQQAFVRRFQQGHLPEDMPEIGVAPDGDSVTLTRLLRSAGLVASTSEAIRLIGQGAVRIDGERVHDHKLSFAAGADLVCQVGKRRFARVRVG
jgi:tyrosyl-tRNA synthetase